MKLSILFDRPLKDSEDSKFSDKRVCGHFEDISDNVLGRIRCDLHCHNIVILSLMELLRISFGRIWHHI